MPAPTFSESLQTLLDKKLTIQTPPPPEPAVQPTTEQVDAAVAALNTRYASQFAAIFAVPE